MSEFRNSVKAFLAALVLGVGATALVWGHQRPEPSPRTRPVADGTQPAFRGFTGDAAITLAPDEVSQAGAIRIAYRGRVEPHALRIDVTIPALDPFYAYPHIIDVATAKNGFTLAGNRFQLLSVSRSGIRIKWTGPPSG